MLEDLGIPAGHGGAAGLHVLRGPMRAPHRHAELELNVVLAGSARYLVGDRRYDLAPGTVAWLFPGQDHILAEHAPGSRMWVVVFEPGLVAAAGGPPPLRADDPPGRFCRRVPPAELTVLDGLAGGVASAREAGDGARARAGLAYLLLTAWAYHDSAAEAPAPPALHPAVEHAARLLRDDAPPLPALAAAVGLSPSRLSRLFRAQTGMSITEFRNRQRLARFLALEEEHTVLDAALRAGFGSYPQFHRVFREVLGESPGAFRRARRRRGDDHITT